MVAYSECVFEALVIQFAKCMLLLYCHVWPAWIYHIFPHCHIWLLLFSLQLLPETFLILRRNERDITNLYLSSCKVTVILVGF